MKRKFYNKNISCRQRFDFDVRVKEISLSISQSNQKIFQISPFIWPISKKIYIYTIFSWNFGGKSIYLTGNWDGWRKQIPLRKSGNEFITILPLPLGRFQYKFTVDGEWKYAPNQKIEKDFLGNLNNYIDIEKFDCDSNLDEYFSEYEEDRDILIPHQKIISKDVYKKDPPNIPPHLSFLVESNSKKDEKYFTFSKFSYQRGKALRVFLNHILYLKNDSVYTKSLDKIPSLRIRIRGKFFTFLLLSLKKNIRKQIHPLKILFF
jgi:hypothetical protein